MNAGRWVCVCVSVCRWRWIPPPPPHNAPQPLSPVYRVITAPGGPVWAPLKQPALVRLHILTLLGSIRQPVGEEQD